eukprot:tig00020801_g13907.t1
MDRAPISQSSIVAGLDWVLRNHRAPAIVNLSFGGPGSSPSMNAIAKSPYAVAVGATEIRGGRSVKRSSAGPCPVLWIPAALDALAPYSNRGPCLSLLAPGTSITSAFHRSPGSREVMTGTSMFPSAPVLYAGAVPVDFDSPPLSPPLFSSPGAAPPPPAGPGSDPEGCACPAGCPAGLVCAYGRCRRAAPEEPASPLPLDLDNVNGTAGGPAGPGPLELGSGGAGGEPLAKPGGDRGPPPEAPGGSGEGPGAEAAPARRHRGGAGAGAGAAEGAAPAAGEGGAAPFEGFDFYL